MARFLFILISICIYSWSVFAVSHDKAIGPELNGRWLTLATFCSFTDGTRNYRTPILKIESLAFEPLAALSIFDTPQGKVLRKAVSARSCQNGNEALTTPESEDLLYSTYAVRLEPHQSYGQGLYGLRATQLISMEINSQAIQQCGGGSLRGRLLDFLIGRRYPEYTKQEMNRKYYLQAIEPNLYLRFVDPEICPGSATVMVFRRLP